MIGAILEIAKNLLALVGWGTKKIDRAQDVKAGRDAATVEFKEGERELLTDEIAARAKTQAEQMAAMNDQERRRAELRDDPNTMFRKEKP